MRLYEGKIYLLCGEFFSKNEQQEGAWSDFATLKTEGYEVWIGGNASAYCKDSKKIDTKATDLVARLNQQK